MQVGEGRSPLEWAQHQDLGGAGAEEDVGQSGKGGEAKIALSRLGKSRKRLGKGLLAINSPGKSPGKGERVI